MKESELVLNFEEEFTPTKIPIKRPKVKPAFSNHFKMQMAF